MGKGRGDAIGGYDEKYVITRVRGREKKKVAVEGARFWEMVDGYIAG